MRTVQGVVQHYAWGDAQAIPELLGVPGDGQPWAEYWLGTHPNGPAHVDDDGPLTTVTGELPFMLKILAAAQPLSLQAHPDATRAAEGHAAGVYPDPFPKPELLCALTPFYALCGVRPLDDTLQLLGELGADDLARALDVAGIAATLEALYREVFDPRPAIEACRRSGRPEAALVQRLDAMYPGEPSVVVTLLLNHVSLAPGQAIFLGSGNLHAYLRGVGVEMMAASDNVVRGGLTVKEVDADELLQIVDPAPLANPVVEPVEISPGVFGYDTPRGTDGTAAPFVLWRLETGVSGAPTTHEATNHELLICTAGGDDAWRRGQTIHLAPGESVILPSDSTIHVASSAT